MDSRINDIMETESQAQKRVEALKEQEETFSRELAEEVALFREKTLEHARGRIEKTKEAEERITKKALTQIEETYHERRESLEKQFSEEEVLVEKLYEGIIKEAKDAEA